MQAFSMAGMSDLNPISDPSRKPARRLREESEKSSSGTGRKP